MCTEKRCPLPDSGHYLRFEIFSGRNNDSLEFLGNIGIHLRSAAVIQCREKIGADTLNLMLILRLRGTIYI